MELVLFLCFLSVHIDFTIEPNQLTISNVSRVHNGLYKCVATNGLERTASRIIELDVQFPPTIHMTNNKIGQLIHRTTMVRAVITGNPINSFYWEFERRPIYGPNSNCLIPMPNDKYCVLVDKFNAIQREVKTTLFITNLTKHDYGLYTCVVETPFGIFRNSTEVFRELKRYILHT
ncbi:Immunoglobulin I-set domain protein [Paragonimus heterotremus]|uniref:Immunoglobulin I-set domain protein n=1 Tax=Paragonimus heterotremus TaxID=100268 RepID=A0A8J4TSW9_9TREM|nr:Immunoglobulin I-set domain protein [Paragonimus heterotremus]